jgi:AhpD family alkylhydroperoxidase
MTHEDKNASANVQRLLSILYEASPEMGKHFGEISKAALQQDVLSTKTKQLIALAISIILRSKECVAFHLTNLIKKEGMLAEEMVDILTICVYMGGGPILMSAAEALEEYYQIQQANPPQHKMAVHPRKQATTYDKQVDFRNSTVKGYE